MSAPVRPRRPVAIAAFLAFSLCLGAVLARPHLVRHWGLYLGSPAQVADARLFLDPFPDESSCRSRVAVFAANGERAFCAAHLDFALGSAQEAALAAEFGRLSPANRLCTPPRTAPARWDPRSPRRSPGMILRPRRLITGT